MQIKIKVCALFVSLNVTNEFTPQYNEMGNDHLRKSIKCSHVPLLVYVGNRGEREARLLFIRLLSLDISTSVSEQILRDRVWQEQQVQQPCFVAPVLFTFSLLGTVATAHNSFN